MSVVTRHAWALLRPKEVADLLSRDHNATKQLMWRMAERGELRKDPQGGVPTCGYIPITPLTAVTLLLGRLLGYEGYWGLRG